MVLSIEFVKNISNMKWEIFAEILYLLAYFNISSEALIFMCIKKIKAELFKISKQEAI